MCASSTSPPGAGEPGDSGSSTEKLGPLDGAPPPPPPSSSSLFLSPAGFGAPPPPTWAGILSHDACVLTGRAADADMYIGGVSVFRRVPRLF